MVDAHLPPSWDDTTSRKKPNTFILLAKNVNKTQTVLDFVFQYPVKADSSKVVNSLTKTTQSFSMTYKDSNANPVKLVYYMYLESLFLEKAALESETFLEQPIFKRLDFTDGIESTVVGIY